MGLKTGSMEGEIILSKGFGKRFYILNLVNSIEEVIVKERF